MQAFRNDQKRAALKEKTKIGGRKLSTRLGDDKKNNRLSSNSSNTTLKKITFKKPDNEEQIPKTSGRQNRTTQKNDFNYATNYSSDDDNDDDNDEDTLDHLDDGIGLNLIRHGGNDDINDDGVNHEAIGKKLIEDVRLSAGDKRREIATLISSSCYSHAKTKASQSSYLNTCAGFVGHNRNTVTACCVIDNLIFYGDKSGTVFRAVAMNNNNNNNPVHFDRVPINPSHGKGCGVVSLAISDTRSANHSNLSLYNKGTERSTMDISVGSYLASGGEDGSIIIWKTFPSVVMGPSGDAAKRRGILSYGDGSPSSLFAPSTSSSPLPEYVGVLKLHRKSVTGLAFRLNTSYLLSCSDDTTLRLWSVPEMHCVDRYFGHRGPVRCLSTLRKERCVSGGSDATMRYWKLEAATQVEYELLDDGGRDILLEATKAALGGSTSNISLSHCAVESVIMLDDVIIACGTSSGHLVLYDVNVKTPVQVIVYPHGRGFIGNGTGLEQFVENKDKNSVVSSSPNCICSMAAVPYSDLLATASVSGEIILWKYVNTRSQGNTSGGKVGIMRNTITGHCDDDKLLPIRLDKITAIDIKGCINSMSFSHDGSVLVASVGKEQRQGRWITQREVLNGVAVVPLFFNHTTDTKVEVSDKRLLGVDALLDWRRLMTENGSHSHSGHIDPSHTGASKGTTDTGLLTSRACWVTAPVPYDPTYTPSSETLARTARKDRKAIIATVMAAKKANTNKGALKRQECKYDADDTPMENTEDSDKGDDYVSDREGEEDDAMTSLACMRMGADGELIMDDGDDDNIYSDDKIHNVSHSGVVMKKKKKVKSKGTKQEGKQEKHGSENISLAVKGSVSPRIIAKKAKGPRMMGTNTVSKSHIVTKSSTIHKRANKGSLKKKK